MTTPAAPDQWSRWLLERRYGADPRFEAFVRQDVERFRQRVLDGACLKPGMTLVDVGAGDGLIAFGAIERIGPTLQVVLTDISAPLLDHARQLAEAKGVLGQCRFVQGSAEKLDGLADGSADVVAMRAALAYAADKLAAFQEFHRVLKPGGRLSLCEPIMQDEAFEACALTRMIAAQPQHPNIAHMRLVHKWKSAQYPSHEEQIWRTPTTSFNERDLVRLARHVGFEEIHLELHIDRRRTGPFTGQEKSNAWEVFLAVAPHPWAPSLGEIMATQFTADERRTFEAQMRPQVESQQWITSDVVAYLTADKPR